MACTSKCGTSKYGTYQVCVTIIKAIHLAQNANPMVVVKVGNHKKKTMVRERTDCPYFNEYFVFDFTCNLDVLLSTRITISVYLQNCLRQLKFYGGIFFEVATVWDQPNHQYYHKWAMLINPKDPTSGPKGYVKCNITVNAKGEKLKVLSETDGEDDFEGNLLLPLGGTTVRQRARYIFTVYRADGLPTVPGLFRCQNYFENINPYVQISFAGMKGRTSDQRNVLVPQYNEKIIFKEMFPPLCNRVRITIKDRSNKCKSNIIATYILNLSKISNSGEYGFLPTFGPSFIHFYGRQNNSKECCCTGQCTVALPSYRGRILLSLETKIDDLEVTSSVDVKVELAVPIIEKSLWRTDEYLLVGILYDVCMIDRCRFISKWISFEISLGNAGNRSLSHSQCIENNDDGLSERIAMERSSDFESRTVPRATASMDHQYDYLPFGFNKPCVYVKSWWPNVEWRTFNSNILSYIANFLEVELETLEGLIIVESPSAYKKYNEVICRLKECCIHYLHTLATGRYDEDGGTTKLDRHRVNFCRREIESVLRMIKTNGVLPNNHYIKIAMIHGYKYLHKVRDLCKDPQHNLPDVFIWMIAGSKRVAYTHLPSSQIMYFEESVARGTKCGQRINLFMKNSGDEEETHDYSACKIEIFLWLGNIKFVTACWSSIPPGYMVNHEESIDVFPRHLKYNESSIIRQTLDPFWDQMLVFPPIYLYGTRDNIKSMPPEVVIEAFDEDLCGTIEFCGRCIVTPIVKLTTETYSPPNFPPKLKWYKLKTQKDYSGAILAAFELIEAGEDDNTDVSIDTSSSINKFYNIPEDIRPTVTRHRLEVIFWGVRDMRRINYVPVQRPRIIVECAGVHLKSEVMENAKKFCNFEETHLMVDLDLPESTVYYPSITIKAYDSRGFGCFKYIGICAIPTASVFLENLITEEEYEARIHEARPTHKYLAKKYNSATVLPLPPDYDPEKEESRGLIGYKKLDGKNVYLRMMKIVEIIKRFWKRRKKKNKDEINYGNDEDETLDWWSKYFASLQEEKYSEIGIIPTFLPRQKSIATFKLEEQPEFEGFQDRLTTFELTKGKKTGDPNHDNKNFSGKFKGRISIYRWPHPQQLPCKTKCGRNAANGLCDDYPFQEHLKLLVRLYVIKGINLHPSDPLTGKSDPYLCVRLGKNYINDKKNYIPNQLNPTFGKLFEMDATFPKDCLLTIQVWDYDSTSADDLIGETKIDIENRFYSRHRAHCGISKTYATSGYNAWRDRESPTQILEFLCQKNNLPMPEYHDSAFRIGKKKFTTDVPLNCNDDVDKEECMALNVLHQWQDFPICGCSLVPEHIERRPLFNAERPGLEQGSLELWIDMFQVGDLPPKPPIDITPKAPKNYELRVIIWNTADVPLVDNQFLTGEKCSDIYVKGWINYEDLQKTDIHYNSLNGEGNFNWRFVFCFTYLTTEHMMVVKKKMSLIAKDETEQKIPCRLYLQVWDNDHLSPDDFLGALTIDLDRMPKGSVNSKNCTLKIMEPGAPTINLFKVTRTKAWWPFVKTENGKSDQAGKLEMEMILVSADEANKQPVGKGRDSPEPLTPPNRPDTSFSWLWNPWKACRFILCRYYKWKFIFCLMMVLFVMLVACGIYAFPGYLVKRILGA